MGKLSFDRVKQVTPELFEQFVRINKQRQHSLDCPSLYDNPFKLDFVSQITELWNKEGKIEASYLMLDDEMLAYVYGFYYKKKYYYWNISFNPAYKSYSPGKIFNR